MKVQKAVCIYEYLPINSSFTPAIIPLDEFLLKKLNSHEIGEFSWLVSETRYTVFDEVMLETDLISSSDQPMSNTYLFSQMEALYIDTSLCDFEPLFKLKGK